MNCKIYYRRTFKIFISLQKSALKIKILNKFNVKDDKELFEKLNIVCGWNSRNILWTKLFALANDDLWFKRI